MVRIFHRDLVVVSFDSMVAMYPSDFTARYGWFYEPSVFSDADFLRLVVLQEIRETT